MVRLHPRYRLKVPNGIALMGAFLLAVSTLGGVSEVLPSLQRPETTAAEVTPADGLVDSAPAGLNSGESAQPDATVHSKRFKVNLFLFRR